MCDNLPLKGNNSKNSKCRRGARAVKKYSEPTVSDVSTVFATMLNISSELKSRPPRRSDILKDHGDFVNKNSEIHQMIVESDVLNKSSKKVRRLKKNAKSCATQSQKMVSVQIQETASTQVQETASVENQGFISEQSRSTVSIETQKIDLIEIPEMVSECNQFEISSKKQMESSSKKKRKNARRRTKSNIESVNVTCEESSSVQSSIQTQSKESEIVQTVKVKNRSKTLTVFKSETKSQLNKKSRLKAKSISDTKCNLENETEEASSSDKEKTKFKNKKFPPSIDKKKIFELLENQPKDNSTYVQGNLRINTKYTKHAYLTMSGSEMDILIIGSRDRNRALDGDLVVVCINPEEKWFKHSTEEIQKTGVVVCILEKVHSRKAIGFIKKHNSGVLFYPRDSRIPLLRIVNCQSLPVNFDQDPNSFKDTLFLADIIFWKKPGYAFGKLQQSVGVSGDLAVETNAILLENDLDVNPFDSNLLQKLPPIDHVPTADDLIEREDWRNRCIFTIDPATAVDLDDAVSCQLLENGNFEISVHISDVTHYLEAFTPLDKKVADRATTVYLVDNVFHMLPKQLCEVCSLLPGRDKLAFSVIWEMTPSAKVISHRFAKTVINSCCQMAYSQVQEMIENPSKDWSKDPSLIIKGHFEVSQLCETVQNLYKLSLQMRDRRFANGALRIDQPKLYICLDKDTGLPNSFFIEEQKDSNKLIEEFMLLANMTVAKQLYDTTPGTALFRSHKEPSIRILTQIRDMLKNFGVILNIESAGNLQMSLSQYMSEALDESSENFAAKCRMMVINSLCAKSMTRAVYRCSNSIKEVDDLRHYALNVPLYTHFTSPIRRYSDCIVHRLLYASIKSDPLHPKWNSFLCAKLASNCNVKKYSAKVAQEQSSELFFTYLLDLKGPTDTQAVVMDVKNRSIDVILVDVGLKARIYFADMEEEVSAELSLEHSISTIKLTWKESNFKQVINVFNIVDVRIQKHRTLFRLHAVLLPPNSTTKSDILKETSELSQASD